jgi:hypothetical protein
MDLNRRDVLKTLVAVSGAVGLGGIAAGCSDDDDTPPKQDSGSQDTNMTPDQGGGQEASAGDTGSAQEASATDTAAATCDATTITSNHSHSLSVPMADVTAAVEKTYHIQGAATHDHEVTLTAADFAKLANSESVTKTSTEVNTHTHDVTVSCA